MGVVTIAAMLFAPGCLGEATFEEGVPPTDVAPVRPQAVASSSKGAISGLVVDPTVYPIENATVTLQSSDGRGAVIATTTTGVAGDFAFALVEPGTYRVQAMRTDIGSGAALVFIEAERVSTVTITVNPIASQEPYLVLHIRTGLMRCGWSFVYSAAYCPGANTVWNNQNTLAYNVSAGHQAVTAETTWARSSEYMDHDFYVKWKWTDTSAGLVDRALGLPVLRKDFVPAQLRPATVLRTFVPFPNADQDFVFQTVTFYDGQYQDDINRTAGAACSYMILGYCTGVGIAVEFRFTQYVSVFMNEAPVNVKEYSAVPDG